MRRMDSAFTEAGGTGGKSSEEVVLELSAEQEPGSPEGAAHGSVSLFVSWTRGGGPRRGVTL